ncbi:hypothetical protein SKAU_G00312160 [Synaphobranchus kaupii]|uniref:Uncharacterized protein n=1 Tax=Synaphobranchus kaupii TaxID=118154 RepID=A0A9Q1ILC2_SYNKA|nr:hypothetical protein SKAU_G00312160 [Synaphobranchus kaupii]
MKRGGRSTWYIPPAKTSAPARRAGRYHSRETAGGSIISYTAKRGCSETGKWTWRRSASSRSSRDSPTTCLLPCASPSPPGRRSHSQRPRLPPPHLPTPPRKKRERERKRGREWRAEKWSSLGFLAPHRFFGN